MLLTLSTYSLSLILSTLYLSISNLDETVCISYSTITLCTVATYNITHHE